MTRTQQGLIARIPIGLRISAIIGLVLAGVVLSAWLLGGTGVAGQHGGQTEQEPSPADHVPPSGGGH